MERLLLLLPGPMQVPDVVAQAAARPLFFHRSDRFMQFQDRLRSRMRPLLGTQSDVLFISGSGTGVMESAIVNMTSPGDEVIVAVGGVFAERFVKIAEAFGLTAHQVEVDWRVGVRATDIRQAMDRWPNASVIYVTWSESSTGVLIELDEIGRAVRERNKYLGVDAVSGLAVSPLEMDAWSVDVVVAGSQKGLMLPPGLGVVGVGPRAWEKAGEATSPRFTWDWKPYKTEVPATPPLSLMHQLDASLDFMDSFGPGGIYQRHRAIAKRVRDLVESSGLEVYAKRPGDGITAILAPEGMDVDAFRRRLEQDHKISIAGGLGVLAGQILRIGHVGHLTDDQVDYFADSFQKVLARETRSA